MKKQTERRRQGGNGGSGRPLSLEFLPAEQDGATARERQFAALCEASSLFVGADTLEDLAPRLLERVATSLNWPVGEVWRACGTDERFTLVWRWVSPELNGDHLPPRSGTVAGDSALLERASACKRPAWISGLDSELKRIPGANGRQNGLRSAFTLPVQVNETVAAILVFYSTEQEKPDSQLLQVLSGLGTPLGQFIARREREARVRDSEQRYRRLIDRSPAVVFAVSNEGVLTDLSPAFPRITGWTLEETLGRHFSEITHPEDVSHAAENIQRALRGDAPPPFEVRVRTKDGPYVVAEIRIEPMIEDAAIVGISGTGMDVTDRRKAEEELRESERRYRRLIEALGVAVYTTDAKGRITYCNEPAVELWGRRPVLGKEMWCGSWRLYRADGTPMPHAECPMARTIKQQRPIRGEEILVANYDGSRRYVIPHPTPMFDSTGKLIGAVNALIDITDRKEAEKLVQKQAQQKTAVAELGQLALASPPLQQLFQAATEIVAEVLENEYCKVLELLPGGERLLLRAGVGWKDGLVGRGTVDTGTNSQAGHTLRSRAPVIVKDLRTESRFRGPPLLVEHNVISGLSLTIGNIDEPFGVLGTHSTRERNFTTDDVAFLQSVANILASAVDRTRAEEALQESESNLRLAIEAGRMGTWEWDVKTNAVSWSETLEEIHGLEPGTFGGKFEDFQRDIHPEDRNRVLQAIGRSIDTGTHELEYRIIRQDGSTRWLGTHGRVLHDDAGNPAKMTGVSQDITERKTMEERLRLKREALEIASRLSLELDTGQLVQSVINEATHLTGATYGAFYICAAADTEGETLHRYALAGDVNKMPEVFPAGPNSELLTAILERKKVLRVDDVTREPSYANAGEAFASAGASIQSILALPVISRAGQVLGAMLFAHTTPSYFTEQHQFVMSSLAPEIGVAMDNARLYEAEQAAKMEAEKIARDQSLLYEAGMRLQTAAPDERIMMSAVGTLIVPEMADWCAIHLLTPDGGVDTACVVHKDAEKVSAAVEARRKFPVDLSQPYGLGSVVKTGKSAIYPEVTPQLISEAVKDPERRRTLEAFDLKAIACIPISSRGRVMGVMSLAMADSDRRFDEKTMRFAEELGKRIGLALDNSRLVAELERSIESKDEFLGVVSHELRTPITAIYGGSRLLRARGERLDSEVRSRLLNDIEDESERMYRLVENLLALTRVELGQEIHIEPVLVRQVLQQITRAHQEKHRKREVEVSIEDESMMVDAQPVYFEQILHNLVTNAEKYSPKGSPIRVTAHRSDGYGVVSVSNEAPDMDEDELNKIFERFYRSEKPGRASRGIGLGLTVCKRLVAAMGGKITADRISEELIVSFTLPLSEE